MEITSISLSNLFLILVIIVSVVGCDGLNSNNKLPIYGREQVVERKEGIKTFYDTLPHQISDFKFVNQDSIWISNETFADKIYVADFFFTSCPTICPAMKKQMLRVYDKFKMEDRVAILSHTIDPRHDSVKVLKEYAERLGVNGNKWHFVTGDEDEIYDLGEGSYMVTAGADKSAPGGYIHSGAFLLVDMDRRVRGVYDGTIPDQVDILLRDIDKLLAEYEK